MGLKKLTSKNNNFSTLKAEQILIMHNDCKNILENC